MHLPLVYTYRCVCRKARTFPSSAQRVDSCPLACLACCRGCGRMRAILIMHTLLIYNPVAGRPRLQHQVPGAVAELQAVGWSVDLAETTGPDSAMHLARDATAKGYDAVVVAGGDGTVNQAANGLMQARGDGLSVPALGILPAGTANVLARDLGLPVPLSGLETTLPAAARLLARSRIVSIDVGVARNASE
jgi:diacylglycerol kinase (ATP)